MALNITLHIEEGVTPDPSALGYDYEKLSNKPTIGGVEVIGDKTLDDYGLDLSDYALKSEIPDLDGYATEQYVDDAIDAIDLSDYALKSELPTDTTDLTNGAGYQTEQQVATKIESYGYVDAAGAREAVGTVYTPKGSVATYADLPVNASVGDVYNVIAAYGDVPAGTNWVKTADGWDALGGTVDLSAYALRSELGTGAYATVETVGVVSDTSTLPTTAQVKTFVEGKGYQTSSDVASAIAGKADTADLGTAAYATVETTGVSSDTTTLPTTAQVKDYVDDAIAAIPAPEFVLFDANGGTGFMPEALVRTSTIVPECAYTKDGWEFQEWNTEADGTGTSYQPGDELEPADDVTLYARWSAAYAILDSQGNLVMFRSYNVYENATANTTAVDIDGVSRTGKVYAGLEDPTLTGNAACPWYSDRNSLRYVYVAQGQVIRPYKMNRWFYTRTRSDLLGIDLNGIDTSRCTSMNATFRYVKFASSNPSYVDLSPLDTSKVVDFQGAFADTGDNIGPFNIDTSSAENMSTMFSNSNIKSLDLSSFDTSNVTRMYQMFKGCLNLESLDVSSFDTRNVENMSQMFNNCTKLRHLDLSSFDTRNVTNFSDMFGGCTNLYYLDISGFSFSPSANPFDLSGLSALRLIRLGQGFTLNGYGGIDSSSSGVLPTGDWCREFDENNLVDSDDINAVYNGVTMSGLWTKSGTDPKPGLALTIDDGETDVGWLLPCAGVPFKFTVPSWYYKTGYVLEYIESADGSHEVIYPDQTFVAEGLFGEGWFFGSWRPAEYYVAFDPNGGTGEMDTLYTEYGENEYVVADETMGTQQETSYTTTVPACSFTPPTGMQFAGWNTKANGTGTSYSDQFSCETEVGTQDGVTVTLYAQWEAV